MASTIAFACSRALSRIDFEKIGNWLMTLNKTLIDETDSEQFLYQGRSREFERRFQGLNDVVFKLANEIETAMIDVKEDKNYEVNRKNEEILLDEDILVEEDNEKIISADEEKEGMQLTYGSIAYYMNTKKPEWYENVQYIYDIHSSPTKEKIQVNEPIAVKALFDLAWNNKVVYVKSQHEFNEVEVRNYINRQFARCKEPGEFGRKTRPTHITLATKFHNTDIPTGTSVFYYDTNGTVHGKVIGTNYTKLNPITRDTLREDFPLEVYIETYKKHEGKMTRDKIKQRTETDTYFLRDAPARVTKKLWHTQSSARSRSRSRSPERIQMAFSLSKLVAKPSQRKELEIHPLIHENPMKRRVRSESRSSSRERFRRKSDRNEERSRSRSRSRSRDRFGNGGRKTRRTNK